MSAPSTLHGTIITALCVFIVVTGLIGWGFVCGASYSTKLQTRIDQLEEQLAQTHANLDLCINEGEVDE